MSERIKRVFYCSRCGRYSLNLKPYALGKEWLCSFCYKKIYDERYYMRNYGVDNESKTLKDKLIASISTCPICKKEVEKTKSRHKRVYCTEKCKNKQKTLRATEKKLRLKAPKVGV